MIKFTIQNNQIVLPLTYHRSKIRISDENGNHISKPVSCKIDKSLYIEWMITNEEIKELLNKLLNFEDKKNVKSKIEGINSFIKTSEFSSRNAGKNKFIKEVNNFKVYENNEIYYSFERTNANGIKNKIVFKMGDFTLAPFYFLLIPFSNSNVFFQNKTCSELETNSFLGSGAKGVWSIEKSDIENLIIAISSLSIQHKNDMISFLE